MVHTRGNIIVENIKIGDIHYEFEYGVGIKTEVLTLPIRDENGYWTWDSKIISDIHPETNGKIVHYGVNENYSHYAPKLYDYIAYSGCKFV